MEDRKNQEGGTPGIDRSRRPGREDKMPEKMPGNKEHQRIPEHKPGGGYGSDRGPNP